MFADKPSENSKKSNSKNKRNRRQIRLIAEYVQPTEPQLEIISLALWSFINTPAKAAFPHHERPAASSCAIEFQEVTPDV